MNYMTWPHSEGNQSCSVRRISNGCFHQRPQHSPHSNSQTSLRGRTLCHLPVDYPLDPPEVRFETPISHPNISAKGEILWTFWGTSGPLARPFGRCSYACGYCYCSPISMKPWCLRETYRRKRLYWENAEARKLQFAS